MDPEGDGAAGTESWALGERQKHILATKQLKLHAERAARGHSQSPAPSPSVRGEMSSFRRVREGYTGNNEQQTK